MPRSAQTARAVHRLEDLRARGQREATERLKRELSKIDPHARSRYVRRFLAEFSRAEADCALREVFGEAVRADLIYLADYHALPAAQGFAVRLVNLLCSAAGGGREVVLCLETFYERDQKWLEAYLGGGIEEAELLRRTRYETEWGYEWAGYRSLLEAARRQGVKVFGLDSPLRHSPRLIGRRDAAAAERLARLMAAHPQARFVVFFGESHLAAEHLPGRVQAVAASTPDGGRRRELVIAQNVDELYWQCLSTAARPEAARVAPGKYCVFTATPLEKYHSYARVVGQWLGENEVEEAGGEGLAAAHEAEVAAACLRLLGALLGALELAPRRPRLRRARLLADSPPEIYCAPTFGGFAALLRRAGASASEIKTLRGRAQTIGCAYARRLNALFVSAFDPVSVSEELARFITAALRGQLRATFDGGCSPQKDDESRAAVMLDEALVFFASKLLAPHRAAPLPLGSPTASGAARLRLPRPATRREAATLHRARLRGEAMYQALLDRRITPADIHQLFAADSDSPGHAGRLWDEWANRLDGLQP